MSLMTEAVASKRVRIEAVDVVLGVIMILMAPDHARDFFGDSGVNPTDPTQTTIRLFFTRWVTHFCAPGFFLLTGTGAYPLAAQEISEDSISSENYRLISLFYAISATAEMPYYAEIAP